MDTLWGNRIDIAIQRLQSFVPPEGYFLAFSGGKDSQALYHLAVQAEVPFDAHYSVTGVDPPELLRFIKQYYPNVIWDRPKKTMWQLIVDKGRPPTRVVRYCCDVLKEGTGDGRLVITGVRAAESARRSKTKLVQGCQRRQKTLLHPILDWSDQDVWAYHESLAIPHCSLYDEGFSRIGCIGCPLTSPAQQKLEFARWPKYEALYRRACDRSFARRLERGLPMDWTSGTDMFDWWLGDRPQEKESAQIGLFE